MHAERMWNYSPFLVAFYEDTTDEICLNNNNNNSNVVRISVCARWFTACARGACMWKPQMAFMAKMLSGSLSMSRKNQLVCVLFDLIWFIWFEREKETFFIFCLKRVKMCACVCVYACSASISYPPKIGGKPYGFGVWHGELLIVAGVQPIISTPFIEIIIRLVIRARVNASRFKEKANWKCISLNDG